MHISRLPLVRMADEGKRPSRWWLAWIVAVVLIVVPGAVGLSVGESVLGTTSTTDTRFQYTELFSFGLTLAGLFLWVVLKERRSFTSVGFRGPAVGRLLLGLVIGALMMSVGVGLPTLLGQYTSGASQHTSSGGSALLSLLPLLLVFVLQGSTEEAVTRGYMLQMGGRQLPAWVAIVGSSVIFAVIHLDFRPTTIINTTLYAIFASLVALEQGSLWLICGIHAGWNYFQGNIYGLPVSGHTEATSLFSFGPTPGDNELISGGNYGVEASIIGTLVLVVATLIAYARLRRRATSPVAAETPEHATS